MFSTFQKVAPPFDEALYIFGLQNLWCSCSVCLSINVPAFPSLVFCEEDFHSCLVNVLLAAAVSPFTDRSRRVQ